jgi:hypothetical protein
MITSTPSTTWAYPIAPSDWWKATLPVIGLTAITIAVFFCCISYSLSYS